jgi:diguanylate cyclase (GGDEF)-like protein/hemerythrin-like metal-binding protein
MRDEPLPERYDRAMTRVLLRNRAFVTGFVTLLSASSLLAGSASRGYTVRHWGEREGLPQATVTSMAQTPDGFLWVGTFGGLLRFDGVRFRVESIRKPIPFEGLRVVCMLAEPDGTLLVGTEQGLAQFSDDTLDWARVPPELDGAEVRALYRDSGGTLWVGSEIRGVARGVNGAFVLVPPTVDERARPLLSLAEDAGGHLVIWPISGHALRLVEGRLELLLANEASRVARRPTALLPRELLARLRLRPIHGPVEPAQRSFDTIREVAVANDGALWLATTAGLWRVKGGEAAEIDLGQPQRPNVRTVLCDRESSVWVGTERDGLFQVVPRIFASVTVADGLPGPAVQGLAGDPAGGIMAALGCDGLAYLRPDGTVRATPWPRDKTPGCPWAVCPARSGGVWVGTYDGPIWHVDGNGTMRQSAMPIRDAVALFRDRNGRLWAGSRNLGAFEIDEGPPERAIPVNGVPSTDIRGFADDSGGRLWIATARGVAVLDRGAQRARPVSAMPAVPTRAFFIETDRVWVGTYGAGLAVGDGTSFVLFDTGRGLFENVVSWVCRQGGWMWWTGNRGIYRARRDELLKAAADPTRRLYPQRFTVDDGLPSNETNGGGQPAGWHDPSGRLWFPTISGLAVLEPGELEWNAVAPVARLDRVLVDDHEVSARGPLRLSPGVRSLEIEFTTATLAAPARARFSTRLVGLDPDWVDTGGTRSVQYGRLAPGTYVFRVRVSDEAGGWVEGRDTLTIVQRPMFIETWLFRVLIGLVAFGMGAGLYWGRAVALTRRSVQLESVVQERTAELVESNRELADAKAELEMAVDELERLASTDKLTGAWNRRQLERVIPVEMSRSLRTQRPLSLILLDADHFKTINDRLGHEAGDHVLVELVRRLERLIRLSDGLTRYGGEEFLLLLPHTGLGSAIELAERARRTIESTAFAGVGNVTISLGAAEWFRTEPLADWIKRADMALYLAKREGRNRTMWDPRVGRHTASDVTVPAIKLVWQPNDSIGEATIDEQHRGLLAHADSLIAAAARGCDASDLLTRLHALIDDAVHHFAYEEGVLERSGYPAFAEHRALHEELITKANSLTTELRNGLVQPDQLIWFLAYEVVAWHMLTADRHFISYVAPNHGRAALENDLSG